MQQRRDALGLVVARRVEQLRSTARARRVQSGRTNGEQGAGRLNKKKKK